MSTYTALFKNIIVEYKNIHNDEIIDGVAGEYTPIVPLHKGTIKSPGHTLNSSEGLANGDEIYFQITEDNPIYKKNLVEGDLLVIKESDVVYKIGTDVTAPTVTSVPANSATDIAIDSNVVLTFSETMSKDTTKAACSIVDESLNAVPGTWRWSNYNTVLTFYPTSDLTNSHDYTVTVTVEAEDDSGNNLASEFTATFTTVAA